jgi:hypothetical protein
MVIHLPLPKRLVSGASRISLVVGPSLMLRSGCRGNSRPRSQEFIFPARRSNSLPGRNQFPACPLREFSWKCLDSHRILLLFSARPARNQQFPCIIPWSQGSIDAYGSALQPRPRIIAEGFDE